MYGIHTCLELLYLSSIKIKKEKGIWNMIIEAWDDDGLEAIEPFEIKFCPCCGEELK